MPGVPLTEPIGKRRDRSVPSGSRRVFSAETQSSCGYSDNAHTPTRDCMRLEHIAPRFIAMAHRIVYATVATSSLSGEPRTRVMHPLWEWDNTMLVGWVATWPTPVKTEHLSENPFASVNYWSESQDNCTADCVATVHTDLGTKRAVWQRFAEAPEPVGFDPSLLDGWDSPESGRFAAISLEPYRLRVFPGSLTRGEPGEILTWSSGESPGRTSG